MVHYTCASAIDNQINSTCGVWNVNRP